MFTAKLFDFQTKHEESLLAKCADHEELVLSAPTGAGKTVLVSKFGCVPARADWKSSRRTALEKLPPASRTAMCTLLSMKAILAARYSSSTGIKSTAHRM